tara:strand:+ start:3646 stop:3879 length:234 start_codon:yes stop_codon:yes gene_type:complete
MKYVEYKIIDDTELPPMIIKDNGDGGLEIVINHHHKIWLALNRNTIPGVVQSMSEKLQEITGGILKEQYAMEKWEDA